MVRKWQQEEHIDDNQGEKIQTIAWNIVQETLETINMVADSWNLNNAERNGGTGKHGHVRKSLRQMRTGTRKSPPMGIEGAQEQYRRERKNAPPKWTKE